MSGVGSQFASGDPSVASERFCTHLSRRLRSNVAGSPDNGGEIDKEFENLEGKFSSRFQLPMPRKLVPSAPKDGPGVRPLIVFTCRLSRGETCRLAKFRLSELKLSALMLAMAPGEDGDP